MEKKLKNEKALEINNQALEDAMALLTQEKNKENMAKFMGVLAGARVLVPAEFPKNMDKETIGRLVRGEKFEKGEAPRMFPMIVQNPQGDRFAPAFTSRKHIPEDQNYQAILNVPFEEVLRVSSDEKLNLKGILLNPSTDKMVLHPQFIDAMKKLKAAAPKTREIKMTKEQFQVFARKNTEWGIIPKSVFTQKADFMKRLDEERADCIAAMYRQPYGDKIPCPYTEKDFDVMVLNISEEVCVASIELPEKLAAPQNALGIYIIWNPTNDDMHYFLLEKGQPDQDNVLSCVTPDGKHQELQTAPPTGSELTAILQLLEEE
jgi:hypothetical protein